MSNYSENPTSCRVDFFKESGKWYTTEAVVFNEDWKSGPDNLIHDCFRRALQEHFKDQPDRLKGMIAICLEPYHEYSHPLMLRDW